MSKRKRVGESTEPCGTPLFIVLGVEQSRLLRESDMAITVPSTFAQRVYGEDEFALLPLPFEAPALELWLHWHASVDDNPCNQWLREKLLASVNGAIVVT